MSSEEIERPRIGRPPKGGEPRRNVGIMLDQSVLTMLAELSATTGTSRNDIVNEAVRRFHRAQKRAHG